jgi:tetratricopeptide (TPR) repeat protein
MDVHEDVSQAEVIHLGEPGWNIEPGDHLVLLPEEQGSLARTACGEVKLDAATGLLRHGDFLARWAIDRERTDSFALALLRLAPKQAADPGNGTEDGAHPGRFMAEAVRLCREDLSLPLGADDKNDTDKPGAPSPFGGRYGLNSLIFFHPSPDLDSLSGQYALLAEAIESRLGLEAAVGIAMYPCLDFRKADALENCQKALEYAMLLPRPHVGMLDSLALNISADKRFSQGDTFGAIKEYQLALLVDENNGMAWNSLGICLAGLSRHSEAERHFTRALACDPGDVMALYNLGYMHQSQGRAEEAGTCYKRCLELEAEHLYALVRLGQLAESAGDPKAARASYEQAAVLPGGKGLTYRHFARLCIGEGNNDEAREHLHEALLHDPQDALAMALLSGMYLDAGEDPEMAASFARQSVSLRPALRGGWLQLARALEALGRVKEAREARLKAGEM